MFAWNWMELPTASLHEIFADLGTADMASLRASCKDGMHVVNTHAHTVHVRIEPMLGWADDLLTHAKSLRTLRISCEEAEEYAEVVDLLFKYSSFQGATHIELRLRGTAGGSYYNACMHLRQHLLLSSIRNVCYNLKTLVIRNEGIGTVCLPVEFLVGLKELRLYQGRYVIPRTIPSGWMHMPWEMDVVVMENCVLTSALLRPPHRTPFRTTLFPWYTAKNVRLTNIRFEQYCEAEYLAMSPWSALDADEGRMHTLHIHNVFFVLKYMLDHPALFKGIECLHIQDDHTFSDMSFDAIWPHLAPTLQQLTLSSPGSTRSQSASMCMLTQLRTLAWRLELWMVCAHDYGLMRDILDGMVQLEHFTLIVVTDIDFRGDYSTYDIYADMVHAGNQMEDVMNLDFRTNMLRICRRLPRLQHFTMKLMPSDAILHDGPVAKI